MDDSNACPLAVLVVEDRPDVADSLAQLLRLHGHRVTVARSAAEALSVAADDVPDAALLDIGLPDGDGWQVARGLLELAATRGRPRPALVAVTARAADADRWRSLDAGIDLHLVKPADPALLTGLLGRVRRAVARSAE